MSALKQILMSTTLSIRRAASRFRFDHNRDDQALRLDTVRVFTTSSPLLDGGDCGVYGAPIAVLTGYAHVEVEGGLNSVRRVDGLGGYIVGRVVELTTAELARLDDVAEVAGDYHRFLAQVRGPRTGYEFWAWVYQLRADAGPVELAASVSVETRIAA